VAYMARRDDGHLCQYRESGTGRIRRADCRRERRPANPWPIKKLGTTSAFGGLQTYPRKQMWGLTHGRHGRGLA